MEVKKRTFFGCRKWSDMIKAYNKLEEATTLQILSWPVGRVNIHASEGMLRLVLCFLPRAGVFSPSSLFRLLLLRPPFGR